MFTNKNHSSVLTIRSMERHYQLQETMTWSPMGLHMHPANIEVYICTQLKQSNTARHW